MSLRNYPVKWSVLFVVTLMVAAFLFWESKNLKIETDILESMPHQDPVLADAREIIRHLPAQDKVFINLEQTSSDRDALIAKAEDLSMMLTQSGLFVRVGVRQDAQRFPELMAHVYQNLPFLLSADDLEQKIKPLLTPEKIRETMEQNRRALEQLDAIGRGNTLAGDPLGFSSVILQRMTALIPAHRAQFYRDHLITQDDKNVLIIAHIKGSSTDTAIAAKIEKLIRQCLDKIEAADETGNRYTLTAVGAYRVALDNEKTARSDGKLAVLLTTLGIGLLLLMVFPRPLIGLLALLPSCVGAIAALFACSFIFKSMSVLAVGFGGAIMAFTVDLGITYLLFLDQPRETYGKKVAREVRSAELLAILTTVGAFLLLLISDFRILAQIGVFSALGAAFAFLFVHFVFPKIFPSLPPARKTPNMFLTRTIDQLAFPSAWKITVAALLGLVMLFFAKPVFKVDLNAMNFMDRDTIDADKKIQDIWGSLSGKCYVFLKAPSLPQLQRQSERLSRFLDADVREGKLAPFFLPTVLFPTPETARENFAAWRAFWNHQRVSTFRRDFNAAAKSSGFAPAAFKPFWEMIQKKYFRAPELPEKHLDMLGVARSSEGYTQINLLTAGHNYDAQDFFSRLAQNRLAKLFDANLFSAKLGDFLKHLFLEIALIISIGLVLVLTLYFLDWQLTFAALAPIVFALVATLGTLKLIGHPLDIPGIMLWIVIMGMGIDYSIYYICTYQRHPDHETHAMKTIRLAIFMAAFTTLIGFGVLAVARHSLLRSIGLVSLLGIGYSLLGAYLILPFLMKKIFDPSEPSRGPCTIGSRDHLRRVSLRYRHLPAYPRLFARMKMSIDPMFKELNHYVTNPRRIMDIGCGFGVPAAWLLEIYPQAEIFGIEPDEERVLIASRVIGNRGRVDIGSAPDFPQVEGDVDYVLMLDMLHFLDDRQAARTFERIYTKLTPGGTLVLRATIPSGRPNPWRRWIEVIRLTVTRTPNRFRPERDIIAFMQKAGFAVNVFGSDTPGIEEKWFVGKKP